MQNYKAGDRICLFGFSRYVVGGRHQHFTNLSFRGAYTARALAGMLHKVCKTAIESILSINSAKIGLLPAYNRQQIPFAWKMYKNVSEKGWILVCIQNWIPGKHTLN